MEHDQKVKRITEILRNRKSKEPIAFTKSSVSHQVPKPDAGKKVQSIDISDLNEILNIDVKNKVCIAEPGVTFSDLVKETLKHNLVPYTVPELKAITIGGAVAGCSIESMSYKYGGFHDSCIEIEVVTAKGDVLECTRENMNKDVFGMVHGTFGTIGIITKLKFKLYPAKQYVHLEYVKYDSLKGYSEAIWQHYTKKDVDLMDGIIHSPKKFVLCIGTFVGKAPYTNSYEWMRIFHKATLKREDDYLKTYDYFFRYDAGCHWIARNYGLENPVLRFLFGKFFLPSTRMLSLARKFSFLLNRKKPDVVVDIFVPFSRLEKFMEFYNKEFDFFPLWMVPYKIEKPYPWINPNHLKGVKDHLFIDLAVYGMKQRGNKDYYRLMELELMKLRGIKTLISHNSYSREEFWSIWNRKNYYMAKKATDPDSIFGDLYDNTKKKCIS